MSHPFTYRRKKRSTNEISFLTTIEKLMIKIQSLKAFLKDIPPLIFQVLDEHCEKNNTKPKVFKPTENVLTHAVYKIDPRFEAAAVTDINDVPEIEKIESFKEEEEDSIKSMWSVEEIQYENANDM